MKLNLEGNRLLAVFGSEDLDIVKFAYFEQFSCGMMTMYNIENYYKKCGIKSVEKLFKSIQSTTQFRKIDKWNTNLIQFSITDRYTELVELSKKYSCNYTPYFTNYNSGNNIAVFTIECGKNN